MMDDRSSRIRDRRVQYESAGLDVADVVADPLEQWQRWHDEAFDVGVAEPNAMTLATVDSDGDPDARIVLVRGADHSGLTFFTNYSSAKSTQLIARPVAAATFAWLDLHRQVRVRGSVVRLAESASDSYFASRPRSSQLGAWASPQSQPIASRRALEALVEQVSDRFNGNVNSAPDGAVPRPPFWGGWVLVPAVWEFWQGRPSRLHDRLRYRLLDGTWAIDRLAP